MQRHSRRRTASTPPTVPTRHHLHRSRPPRVRTDFSSTTSSSCRHRHRCLRRHQQTQRTNGARSLRNQQSHGCRCPATSPRRELIRARSSHPRQRRQHRRGARSKTSRRRRNLLRLATRSSSRRILHSSTRTRWVAVGREQRTSSERLMLAPSEQESSMHPSLYSPPTLPCPLLPHDRRSEHLAETLLARRMQLLVLR